MREHGHKQAHSALPWKYEGQTRMLILSMSGNSPLRSKWYVIEARMNPPRQALTNDIAYTRTEADAQHLVHAVAMHSTLVNALSNLIASMADNASDFERTSALDDARAALDAAEGER